MNKRKRHGGFRSSQEKISRFLRKRIKEYENINVKVKLRYGRLRLKIQSCGALYNGRVIDSETKKRKNRYKA